MAPSARLIGAVNTVVNDDGILTGENTDGQGFMIALEEAGVSAAGKSVVVLGAGGAARAICVELALAGASRLTIVNIPKDLALGESFVKILDENTKVAVDYVPWVDAKPNPAFTPFLREADRRGLRWQSGMQMLVNQAALNITIWTGLKPNKAVMIKAFEEALS